MKTIDDVLERIETSYAFTQEEIKEFLEANKDKIISGWDYCDEHGMSFYDISDIFLESLNDRAETKNISVMCDDYGEYMAVPEKDDINEALNDYRRDLELDIPYYKEGDEVIPLPFIQYRKVGASDEMKTVDFADAYEVWCQPILENEYDFSYTYNYDHDDIEEWWDEGEGTFNIYVNCSFTKEEGDELLADFVRMTEIYKHTTMVKDVLQKLGENETYTDYEFPMRLIKNEEYNLWLEDVGIRFTKHSDEKFSFEIFHKDDVLLKSNEYALKEMNFCDIYEEYYHEYIRIDGTEKSVSLTSLFYDNKENHKKEGRDDR